MSGGVLTVASAVCVAAALMVLRGRDPAARLADAGLGARRSHPIASRGRAFALRWVGRRRRAGGDEVGPFVDGWAANLRAGLPADAALRAALDELPQSSMWRRTAASAQVGADVGASLVHDAASLPTAAERRAAAAAAACWSVAHEHGGRLADALDRVGDGLRAEHVHLAHVRAQLAAPRSTARLLAALPLLGLVMATGVGLNPWHVLLTDRFGWLVLVAGVLLDVAGLFWTARISRAAERAA